MEFTVGQFVAYVFGLTFIVVLASSPVISVVLYISSFFAWYHDLKKKSIVCLILAILFSIVTYGFYFTKWDTLLFDDEYQYEQEY